MLYASWIEIYTQIGAVATTITASYTNQAGTAGKTTLATAIGGTNLREESRIIRLPLADGDTGVQSVQSVTLAGSTGTAGSFGVVIAKPIDILLVEGAGAAGFRDMIAGMPTLPEIASNSCLALGFLATIAAAPPRGIFTLSMVEK